MSMKIFVSSIIYCENNSQEELSNRIDRFENVRFEQLLGIVPAGNNRISHELSNEQKYN